MDSNELIELNINEEKIISYFKDNGVEYFDWGVGYYQEETEVYVRTKNSKIFKVLIEAECIGQNNDYGDKTYFVDRIKSVNYIEISELEYINFNIKSLEYQQGSLVNDLNQIQNELEELYIKQSILNEEK